ncbi:MAG: dihydrolipoyl dehydrogenase family protein [Angustibacter sp.]
MSTHDVASQPDAVVLGLGPGGEDVAGRLADAGMQVVAMDGRLVGGECPYWGCVPTKMMVRAAGLLAEARRVPQLAGTVDGVRPDWGVVAGRVRDEATDGWDDRVAVERLRGRGVTFVRGQGRIAAHGQGKATVEMVGGDGRRWTTPRVIVATGSTPAVPPIPGIDGVPVWTNHEFVEAPQLPASLVVLGGGAVGCELAQVAARFGADVTLVEGNPRLLAAEEPTAGELVARAFEQDGVRLRLGVRVEGVQAEQGRDGRPGVVVRLRGGDQLQAERLLTATGRRIDITGPGLDVLGVDPAARAVPTDECCRVAAGVWALGDLTGHGGFTHMSMYEADVVVRDVLGLGGPPASYHAVPRVTYTDPEVGSVGLTERDARDRYSHVRVGTVGSGGAARHWLHGPGGDGFVTVVQDADSGVLVGASCAGPMGGEVLGFLALAVAQRIPVTDLIAMPYAYPTFHRAIQAALHALDG